MELNKLTTQADEFFCELQAEGKIENHEALQVFLNNMVDYLESQGGAVEGMSYLDGREEEGTAVAIDLSHLERQKEKISFGKRAKNIGTTLIAIGTVAGVIGGALGLIRSKKN